MPITNGSTILAADVNEMTTSSLALVQADAGRIPVGMQAVFMFHNIRDGTSPHRRKSIFVVPYDCLLETVAVQCAEHTAASTATVTVTADGAYSNFPTSVSGTVGSGITKLSRLLYDNTQSSGKSFASTARAFRALTKGSTVTVTAASTSVLASSSMQVTLVLRQFFARE